MSRVFQILCAVSCIGLLAACGTAKPDNEATAAPIKLAPKSIGACLRRGGATIARSTNDLAFLSEAEANEEVSKPGFAYDRVAKVMVRVWSASTFEGQPPVWELWIAQPFGKDRSPEEIVETKPPHSYVIFMNKPTRVVRRKVDHCINF
jgi:hypothetical protein